MTGRPTIGMHIRGVRLFATEFLFYPEDETQPKIDKLPGDKRVLAVQTRTEIVQQDANLPNGPAVVSIIVEAEGSVSDIRVWRIVVGYQGAFQLDANADVTVDDVLGIHGPAQLYAFAREFVADIARRAQVQPNGLFIPPWNFRQQQQQQPE